MKLCLYDNLANKSHRSQRFDSRSTNTNDIAELLRNDGRVYRNSPETVSKKDFRIRRCLILH